MFQTNGSASPKSTLIISSHDNLLTKFKRVVILAFAFARLKLAPVLKFVYHVHQTMRYQPTEIKRLSDGIAVQWSDGHRSEFSHKLLRQECPCAHCKAAREGDNPLRVLPDFSESLKVVDIQVVGRYAIRLIWNDGHKTGIYTFEFLRSLNPSPTDSLPVT
jgi:DUF971 family protein